MLTSCDKHKDHLVVYDPPIVMECPVCLQDKEYDDMEKENSKLEDKVEELEQKLDDIKAELIEKVEETFKIEDDEDDEDETEIEEGNVVELERKESANQENDQ